MKHKLLSLLLFIAICSQAQVQNPYSLSWKTDGAIAAYSAIGLGTFAIVNSHVTPLTSAQIAQLDAQKINRFDRNTTQNYKPNIDNISDYSAAGSCVISVGITGLLTMYATQDRQSFWDHASTLAVMCAETNMLTVLTTNIIKSSVLRTRPYVYNSSVPLDDKTTIHARKSFFSSHTAFTAANTFFMAQIVSDYYPHTWASYSAWGVAAALPAAIAYMRVDAGRHFPTDVIAGYVFGTACGLLVPYLHKTKQSNVSVGMSPKLVSVLIII